MNATIDTYNKAAAAYAAKFNGIGSRRNDIERAFALCGKKEGSAVIEWGCGNGRDAQVILEYTSNYIGIDASEEMIALAKKELPDADFRVADIATFETPVNTDIVFAFASLLHFNKETNAKILAKTHAALSPGGIVYISLKREPYEERIVVDDFGPRTFYFYERKDIEEMLGELYEMVWYEEQLMKEIKWFTVALRKKQ